jgi:hypothetical protein
MAVAGSSQPMQQHMQPLMMQSATPPFEARAAPGFAGPVLGPSSSAPCGAQLHDQARWALQQAKPRVHKPKTPAAPGREGDKPDRPPVPRRPGGTSRKAPAGGGGVAATPAEPDDESSPWWNLHGMFLRIPPLWKDMGSEPPTPPRPGFASYAQWARASGAGGGGGDSRSRNRSSRGDSGGAKRAREDAAAEGEGGEEDAAMDALREEDDRWRRCWALVVRRDIAKQQRTLGEPLDPLRMLGRGWATAARGGDPARRSPRPFADPDFLLLHNPRPPVLRHSPAQPSPPHPPSYTQQRDTPTPPPFRHPAARHPLPLPSPPQAPSSARYWPAPSAPPWPCRRRCASAL